MKKLAFERFEPLLWLSVALIAVAPFVVLVFYNHPAADDFLWAAMIKENGLWQFQVYSYLEWSGRYFSNFLVSLNPIILQSVVGYQLVGFFNLILFAFSVYFLWNKILPPSNNKIVNVLAISLLMVVLYLGFVPSVVEMFYWLTGANVYNSGNSLFLIFLGFFYEFITKNKNNNLFLVLLIIAIAGCNEIIIFPLGAVLGCTWLLMLWQRDSRHKTLLFLLGVSLVFVLVSLLASGNYARATVYDNPLRMNLAFALKMTLIRFMSVLAWSKNVALWAVSLLFLPLSWQFYQRTKVQFAAHPIFITLAWLSVIFIAYFPSFWATGQESIATRVVSTVYFVFLFGWFLNIYVWFIYFSKFQFQWFQWQNSTLTIFKIMCLLLFVWRFFSVNNNIGKAYQDLSAGYAQGFHATWQARYEAVKQQPQQAVKVLPLPIPYPNTLFFSDLNADINHWHNREFARLYGLQSIRLK